jgi:hypothetical protein
MVLFPNNQYFLKTISHRYVLKLNAGEYRRGNRKWTIKRNWQHRVHKDEEKKTHNTICVEFVLLMYIINKNI